MTFLKLFVLYLVYMNKIWFGAFVMMAFIGLSYNLANSLNAYKVQNPNYFKYSSKQISLKEYAFDISSTNEDRVRGLSGRDIMCYQCGMIFVFEEEQTLRFWMKEMKFDIDIIYLDRNKKVVDIYSNVKKELYPEVYNSSSKAMYAIEFNAGVVSKLNIKKGDILLFEI